MREQYPQYFEALQQLGPDRKRQAEQLRVSERQMSNYMTGKALPSIETLERTRYGPELLRKLAADIEARLRSTTHDSMTAPAQLEH